MSTRAVYKFLGTENHQSYSIYKHYDGYPEGTIEAINKTFEFAWPLPRYESSDCAAAFVAANKEKGGGSVYLTSGHECHGDLDYYYEIMQAPNGQIIIKAFEVSYDDNNNFKPDSATPFYYGRLKDWQAAIDADNIKNEIIKQKKYHGHRL